MEKKQPFCECQQDLKNQVKDRSFFQGTDITDLPPNERKINTVFQKYALFPHLNIYDNISFGLKEKFQKEVDRRWGNLLYKCDR